MTVQLPTTDEAAIRLALEQRGRRDAEDKSAEREITTLVDLLQGELARVSHPTEEDHDGLFDTPEELELDPDLLKAS